MQWDERRLPRRVGTLRRREQHIRPRQFKIVLATDDAHLEFFSRLEKSPKPAIDIKLIRLFSNHNLIYTHRILVIFALFESHFEGAFEWCKNHQNPMGIA